MAFQTPSTLGVVHSPTEYSESIRPAGKYRAAPWLPVKVFDNNANEYVVMYSGCPVAGAVPAETAGRNAGFTDLFPVGFLGLLEGDTPISYTATDVAVGTIDIVTGVAVVTGGIGTRTALQIRTALGLDVTSTVGTTFDIPAPAFFIGALSYTAYRFPGGDGSNPNGFAFTNFSFQDQIAITCDYVFELPVTAGATLTGTATAVAGDAAADTISVTLGATPDTVVGSYSVTVNGVDYTSDATISAADPTLVTFATYDLVLDDVVAVTAANATYSSVLLAGTPAYVAGGTTGVLADVGIYVKAGPTEGTYIPWVFGTDNPSMIAGQIISVDRTINRGALDKVRTQYQSGTLNTTRLGLNQALYQQPGSATGGLPGNLHRAMGTSLNGVVRINLFK